MIYHVEGKRESYIYRAGEWSFPELTTKTRDESSENIIAMLIVLIELESVTVAAAS